MNSFGSLRIRKKRLELIADTSDEKLPVYGSDSLSQTYQNPMLKF